MRFAKIDSKVFACFSRWRLVKVELAWSALGGELRLAEVQRDLVFARRFVRCNFGRFRRLAQIQNALDVGLGDIDRFDLVRHGADQRVGRGEIEILDFGVLLLHDEIVVFDLNRLEFQLLA